MFVHDDIGEQGGTIKVSGVTMEIPKGALKERTTITVGIVWDKEKIPELLSKHALISPLVVCEPTGQQFLIPVKITMSHCALNVKQKWNTRLMKCEEPLSQTSNWSNTDEQTVVKDHEVTFLVKHFTQYALIGESNGDQPCAKSVNLVTFTSLLRVGDFFKVRIYCVDSYKDEQHQKQIEYINKNEVKMGGKKASQDNALFFKNNGKNMLVSLKDISKGCDLSGVNMEEMPFESVWHSEIPSCTFIFDPKDEMSNKILCQFASSQVDGDCSCQFKIAERVVMVDPISGIPVDASTRVSLANNEVNLPYSIHRQLIMSLDAPNALGNDWRGSAEEIGMNLLEVNYIESKHNPTSILLDKWKPKVELSRDSMACFKTCIGKTLWNY